MQAENPLDKYTETLRTHYWTGHFFLIMVVLIVVFTFFPTQSAYGVSLPVVALLWAISLGLMLIIQRDVQRLDLQSTSPWPPRGLVYVFLSTALVVLIIIATGGHQSFFRLLAIVPVILCSLHYGWQCGVLSAFLTVLPLLAIDRLFTHPPYATLMGEDVFLLAVMATVAWLIGQVTSLNHRITRDLADKHAFLQLVINSSPSGLFAWDKENRISFANTALKQMADQDTLDLVGQQVEAVGQALNTDLMPLIAKVGKGTPIKHYHAIRLQDGVHHHLELDLVPLQTVNPEGAGLCCIRDVTANIQLGQLQVQSECILEMLDLGVIVVNSSDQITTLNRSAKNILGVEGDMALGSEVATLWAKAGFSSEDTNQLLKPNAHNVAVTLNNKHLLVHQTVLKRLGSSCGGRVMIINDVTERQRIEDELRRAATLAVVGEMSAGMAHEIRNPLAAVRGFAQLLSERKPDEPIGTIQPYLGMIIQEIDRVNKLVRDFLLLSQPRHRVREPVDLSTLARYVVELVQNQAIVNGTTLETDLAAVPAVAGDEEQLRQVMLNLINNAFAAAGKNGRVRVSTGAIRKEVFVQVRDSGPGVPPEMRLRIFDPFFTTKEEGTGLGLAICERIIKEHEGHIEVKCDKDGTFFTVWLPLAPSPSKESGVTQQ